ncbi:MAG: DNA primase family protein [Lachnospiraceae bacterium]|jgi:putative DNA primase/helicase
MQEAVVFDGFLDEGGNQIPMQIPASAYMQLGERRMITAKEALAVGMDLTHLANGDTGKPLFSEDDLLAIRLANSQIKAEGESVQVPELQSIAEETRAKAVGLQPAVSFVEVCKIPRKEGTKLPALIEEKASMSKEQLAPAEIYKATPVQNDEFLVSEEDDKALIAEIENYLCFQFDFRIYDAQIYLFNADIGFYRRVLDHEIDYLVNEIFGERIKKVGKSYIYREVREFLRRESKLLVKESQLLPPRIWVFRDKFVNAFSGETRPNDGNVFVCSALQCKYDEYATCPDFEVYLDSIAGGDGKLVQLLWEVIAYLLSRETRAKKIVFLIGKKDSGKSLFADILTGILGEESVSTLSANDFGKQFGLAELMGRHLNICMDLPDVPLSSEAVGKIKSITGGDLIRADVKFKEAVRFRATVRLLFGSNAMVRLAYPDQAFAERCIFIPFRYAVPREKQDLQLCEKLLRERAGICRKAMNVYADLERRGFAFTTVDLGTENEGKVINWEKVLDVFMAEHCKLTGNEADRVSSESLFNSFLTFTSEKGVGSLSRESFSKKFREKTEGKVEKKKIRIGKETVNGFVGIILK